MSSLYCAFREPFGSRIRNFLKVSSDLVHNFEDSFLGLTMKRVVPALVAVAAAIGLTAGASQRPVHAKDSVTFTEDVAPIVFNNCTGCHRAGEAAPFTLMNYTEVRSHAKLIAAVTSSRRMPPWKAGPSDYEFKNARSLSDADIATIQKWVEAGMPEGDPRKLPKMPEFTQGWELGKPDLIVSMPEAYPVPAYGRDIYRNFVLPLNLTEDKWVRAIDFRPAARGVVHHSLFYLDDTGAARAEDAKDALPGYDGGMGGGVTLNARSGNLQAALGLIQGRGAQSTDPRTSGQDIASQADFGGTVSRVSGGLGGWALGARARALPDGLAYFVPKGSDLILSTHFHPSGKEEKEASVVGLYFTDKAPTKKFTGVQLPPVFGALAGLDIPAGDKQYSIHDSFVLPVDVKAFGTGAHAHYIAKDMKLTATFPDGQVKNLLWIQDWDFAWQEQYAYKDYVLLPKGTRLDGTVSYDNSADNPRNPSNPPRRVTWGEQSTDEMGSVGIQVVAANEADLPVLQAAYAQHVRELTQERVRRAILQGRGRGRQ
jgi:hypothetical protein